MDLRSYLIAIRRGWWILVLFAVLGGAVGLVYAERATPVYAAQLSFYISTPDATSSSALSTDQFAQDRANSYAELLSSEQLGQRIVTADPALHLTARQVASEISATAQLNTVLVHATVKDSSPTRAYSIAKTAASEFPKMVSNFDNATANAPAVTLHVTDQPNLPTAPVAPRKKLIVMLAVLVGALVGLVLAVVRQLLDTSVQTVEMLEAVSGAPTLATIPFDPDAKEHPVVLGGAEHKPRAEALRRLRTNLQFVHAARAARTIAVTSSVEGEGKSTTSVNLALVFAEAGNRVVLVEADLRRPRLGDYLGLEGAAGLTNVLAGEVELDDVLQPWGATGMTVLLSGSVPPNPSELLGGDSMKRLLGKLNGRFDIVIVDTPPILPVTDAAVLATKVDGVVLVFRYGKTNRGQLADAVRSLQSVDARLLGAVFNMKPIKRADKLVYGGYYHEAPSTGAEARASIFAAPDLEPSSSASVHPNVKDTVVGNRRSQTRAGRNEHSEQLRVDSHVRRDGSVEPFDAGRSRRRSG